MTTQNRISTYDCEGEHTGYLEPVEFDDGQVGYQCVDDEGNLLGIVDHRGVGDTPFATGNREWVRCEETPAHLRALRMHEGGDNQIVRS